MADVKRDHRLNVENIFSPVKGSYANVGVVLEGHANEIGDWILAAGARIRGVGGVEFVYSRLVRSSLATHRALAASAWENSQSIHCQLGVFGFGLLEDLRSTQPQSLTLVDTPLAIGYKEPARLRIPEVALSTALAKTRSVP